MNIDMNCRLCLVLDPAYSHTLYDSTGGCTEVYGITVKYFDPMLLVVDSVNDCASQSTIICQECWKHIKDFHDFQQHILLSQNRLLEDVKPLLRDVKRESDNICSGKTLSKNYCSKSDLDSFEEVLHENTSITKLEDGKNNESRDSPENIILTPGEHVEMDEIKEECEQKTNKDLNEMHKDGDSMHMSITELEDVDNYSSDDVPLGQIIFNSNLKEPSLERQRSCRNVRNRKQSAQRNARGRKSEKPKDAKKSPKNTAHNSAEKIQELDDFIAEVKPQLECDLCKSVFHNYNSLRSHFSDIHHTKCFIMCCDKKIFRRYLLVEHLRLHVNPETYKCDICGAISASSRTLISHKRFMHHTAKTLECEVCHRKFKGKPTLIRHMATHATGNKDFKCQQCDRYFAFEFQLKLHINNVHSEIKICDQCGKTVHGAAALKQHLLQHSETKQAKWPCDQCDAQLASLWGLKSHKLSFHPDGTTAFICKECGKVASSEITLKRHKRLVHQMERKYKCTYCEKTFKKNSHLKDHIAIHTGQHIHRCSLCSQTFINSGSLHKHRKKVHPVEWTESRQHRIDLPKVNADNVVREVLL